ncbi:unnamed protein product [Rhizophagus irregularis]|nr:unnamed protein product [Rhizophagus irregularis]
MAFIPATKAYEILLRYERGQEGSCCVWEEDVYRNFITFIPSNVPGDHHYYYCFDCSDFNTTNGADFRNGILTYNTIDNTTTYWVNLGVSSDNGDYRDTHNGGHDKDTCFGTIGDGTGSVFAYLDELSYDDCKKIRDA